MVTTKNLFKNNVIKNDRELLSKEYGKNKWNGTAIIKWKVLKNCHPYSQKKRYCILCRNEKYEIANNKGDNLLDKRTEILGICRDRIIATQKSKVIYQYRNVIKDAITLT